MEALDGLRGWAILLVMINHGGQQLWRPEGLYDVPIVRGLLGGGAVVVFFVVGGFIVGRGLLGEIDRGVMDPLRFWLRRIVRLGVQLVLLAAALIVVQRVDPTAPGTMQELSQNIAHVLTYTMNLLPAAQAAPVRPDLFHLWYLSVQQQCYLLLPLFLVVAHRFRALGVVVLGLLIALVYWHRQVVTEQNWVAASIQTTTRSDGLLWGVALAMMLPLLARFGHWNRLVGVFILATLAFQLTLQEFGSPFTYLGVWSLGYQFFIGALIVAVWLQDVPTLASRALGWSPFAWLGRNSLTLFFWHLPVFVVVARHTQAWHWEARTVLAVLIVAAVTVLLERTVEGPTRQLLATHWLFRAPRVARAVPA